VAWEAQWQRSWASGTLRPCAAWPRDTFGESGPNEALLEKYGLTARHVAAAARELLKGPSGGSHGEGACHRVAVEGWRATQAGCVGRWRSGGRGQGDLSRGPSD